MKREIIIKMTIDWEYYDDVCTENIVEDSGIYDSLKDDVVIEILSDEYWENCEFNK